MFSAEARGVDLPHLHLFRGGSGQLQPGVASLVQEVLDPASIARRISPRFAAFDYDIAVSIFPKTGGTLTRNSLS